MQICVAEMISYSFQVLGVLDGGVRTIWKYRPGLIVCFAWFLWQFVFRIRGVRGIMLWSYVKIFKEIFLYLSTTFCGYVWFNCYFYGGYDYLKCALGTRLHCVWLLEAVLMKDMRLIQIQVYIVSLVPYVLELCNLKD